ncbi:MAG: NUDIX hydrolase [Cyanobacteriota bacterium]|nr:NUDIX hydrolase [Cyanobacteriota bacterium]
MSSAPSPSRFAVALAMLERDGLWLLQLRDDVAGIVHPGTWGLFGGHLDPGESPEQALRRELVEEIGWTAGPLEPWFDHHDPLRSAHFFRGHLGVATAELRLMEGQDLTLASLQELASGQVLSPRLGHCRPLAPSLQLAVRRLQMAG